MSAEAKPGQSSAEPNLYRVVRTATRSLSGYVSRETDDRAQALGWQATYGGRIQRLIAHYWTDEPRDQGGE